MNIEYSRRLEKIESVLEGILPSGASADWFETSFGALPQAVRMVHVTPLLDPARDLVARGGKRWRPLVMVLACELAGGSDRAYALTPIVELTHTASLIHDDIEDGAVQRRGEPAIHIRYGEDTAINGATWLYFQAFSVIDSFPCSDSLKLALYQLTSRELRRLHLGQAMDIRWHRDPSLVPVRSEYEAMVTLKTGTLARLAAESGMLAGGADPGQAADMGELAAKIGVGFQIVDDVLNLASGNPGKQRGDDIVEGKKSLPLIMHLEKHPSDAGFFADGFARAREEGIASDVIPVLIDRLLDSGSVESARLHGNQLIERACLTLRGRYPEEPAAALMIGLFETLLAGMQL